MKDVTKEAHVIHVSGKDVKNGGNKRMNKEELLNMLTANTIEYRKGAITSIKRNEHMNNCISIPVQEEIDAILVDFINFVASKQGVDWGLYTKDIDVPISPTKAKKGCKEWEE